MNKKILNNPFLLSLVSGLLGALLAIIGGYFLENQKNTYQIEQSLFKERLSLCYELDQAITEAAIDKIIGTKFSIENFNKRMIPLIGKSRILLDESLHKEISSFITESILSENYPTNSDEQEKYNKEIQQQLKTLRNRLKKEATIK